MGVFSECFIRKLGCRVLGRSPLACWSFAGVNPLGGDVGCWQSLPGWQTFDVTRSKRQGQCVVQESCQL